jgi:alpha-amylase/alpha-mannosidase (GH57 family)
VNLYVCIHGHFYQPPRENPWLEEIELQDSAYPYHDWNEKITAECYAPNTASRILDASGKIIKLTDNYSKMNFDFGPTLLSWMENHAPDVYKDVIEADRESQKRFSGHGSAIAQAYNHLIMPLANGRDKRTQVLWGIKDFEHRFGRKPEGMWLPETAVDLEALDIMAEEGIKFTVLAPHQAKRVRKIGEKEWKDVRGGKIDIKMPYLCKLPSGRAINLFFYDGMVANEVASGGLLKNGEAFAKRLLDVVPNEPDQPSLVHIATDGETYGHHMRFGDMALAYCFHYIESNNLAKITVYGEYLERNPPMHEVEIVENTSWSCPHGVERWKSGCGCKTGARPQWNQKWRAPVREAMDWLRDNLIPLYEKEAAAFVKDPWRARDDYIGIILNRSVENMERFLSEHAVRELSKEEKIKVIKLLEMQRNAMLMYTSCGWFFDEISGIETVQVIQYAARAIQLARDLSGLDLEPDFIKILERAQSNITEFQNGAKVYEIFVKPATIDLLRVGAHYAVSSLFEKYSETTEIYCYTARSEIYEELGIGLQKLAIGKASLHSDITWEENVVGYVVLHFGGHNLLCGLREFMGNDPFSSMRQEIKDAFQKGDITEVINLVDKHFSAHRYSLRHLFRDEQRKVLNQIVEGTLKDIETLFRQIYDHYYPLMQVMKDAHIPLPKALSTPVEFVLNIDLRKMLEKEEPDINQLQKLIGEVKKWSFEPDKAILGFVASQRIDKLMERLSQTPEVVSAIEKVETLLRILNALPLELDMWKAQNIYFSIGNQLYGKVRERAEKGDDGAKRWIEHFNNLGRHLQAKII